MLHPRMPIRQLSQLVRFTPDGVPSTYGRTTTNSTLRLSRDRNRIQRHVSMTPPSRPPNFIHTRHLTGSALTELSLIFKPVPTQSSPSAPKASVSTLKETCSPTERLFRCEFCSASYLQSRALTHSYHFSYDCNGTTAQKWVIRRGGTKIKLSGTSYCLDAGSSTLHASFLVQLYPA